MDDIKVGDVIEIRGSGFRVARVLPRGYYIHSTGVSSYGQFSRAHGIATGRDNGCLRILPARDAATDPEGDMSDPERVAYERARRSVVDAICDAALRCVGPNPVPLSHAHRDLLAAVDVRGRAVLRLPGINTFRRMVQDMGGTYAKRGVARNPTP